MRKLVVLMHVSLDGYTAPADGSLEWTFRGMNEEISQAANALLSDVDVALYGRQTYQGMQGYWTTVPGNPESTPDEIEHARWVEQISKIVFSTTLETADWNNSKLIKDHIAEEINALKQQPGQTLMIFGSPRLVHSLIHLDPGLIDEYRLFLHPIVLGDGVPLFKDVKESMNLNLIDSKTFGNGVVHLRYQPA
jgi:dihydrofolate reductase